MNTFKLISCSLFWGGIAVFSYSPFHLWPIAFISYIGLIALVANKSRKKAMMTAFMWGIGYFSAGAYWIYISIQQYGDLPIGLSIIFVMLFVAYLAIYPMLFAYLLISIKKYARPFSFQQLVLASPLLWIFTEYLRGSLFNGFAWLEFGYTQLDSPLRIYFPIVGISGVNLITSISAGLILYCGYLIIATKKITSLKIPIFALILIFFTPLLFKNVSWVNIDEHRSARFTLVQGNISQPQRWDNEQLKTTLNVYSSLTQKNIHESDIIIWSEASITDLEHNQSDYLKKLDSIATDNDTAIAVGIIDYQINRKLNQTGEIYNTLIVLGDKVPYDYPTQNRYQKHHLVPFGEYIPLNFILQPIAKLLHIPMSSMSPGEKKQSPLVMKNFKFTTAICYEIILSNLVLNNFQTDTDFILSVSNDAWFGDSIAPWQHLQMATARALEFGRPVIFSTNNGITAFIDHNGNVIKQLPQFIEGVLSEELHPTMGITPYAKWGNSITWFAISLMIIFLFSKRRKNYKMV